MDQDQGQPLSPASTDIASQAPGRGKSRSLNLEAARGPLARPQGRVIPMSPTLPRPTGRRKHQPWG